VHIKRLPYCNVMCHLICMEQVKSTAVHVSSMWRSRRRTAVDAWPSTAMRESASERRLLDRTELAIWLKFILTLQQTQLSSRFVVKMTAASKVSFRFALDHWCLLYTTFCTLWTTLYLLWISGPTLIVNTYFFVGFVSANIKGKKHYLYERCGCYTRTQRFNLEEGCCMKACGSYQPLSQQGLNNLG
jgi:hypothetical protein